MLAPLLMVYKWPAEVSAFEAWLGRRVDGVVNFTPQPKSWDAAPSAFDWAADQWKGLGRKLVLSIPMLPTDRTGQLWQGARGDFDKYWVGYAQSLVARGLQDTIIRIGWEFNGNWQPWFAGHDPVSWPEYFRRIVAAMRSVKGGRFKFCWCTGLGFLQLNPEIVYPGDEAVDIIGSDVYNTLWNAPRADPLVRWKATYEQPCGLRWLIDFARAHRKPMAFPEWGTGDSPSGFGGGDDPLFMTNMLKLFDDHAGEIAFQSIWDVNAGDYNSKLSSGERPKSAALYKARFGARSASAPTVTQHATSTAGRLQLARPLTPGSLLFAVLQHDHIATASGAARPSGWTSVLHHSGLNRGSLTILQRRVNEAADRTAGTAPWAVERDAKVTLIEVAGAARVEVRRLSGAEHSGDTRTAVHAFPANALAIAVMDTGAASISDDATAAVVALPAREVHAAVLSASTALIVVTAA